MDGYQHRHTPQAQVLHNSAMDLPFGLPLTGRMMVAMIAAKECASFGSLTTDIFVGSRHVSNGPNSAGRLFLREWSSEIDSLIAAARHIRGAVETARFVAMGHLAPRRQAPSSRQLVE